MMIKPLLCKAIGLVVLCYSTLSQAELQPFSRWYDVHYGLIHLGSGHMKLEQSSSQTFNLLFNAEPTGLAKFWVKRLIEKSELNIHSSGYLRSLRYHFVLEGREEQNQVILFDYANLNIHSQDDQHNWDITSDIALDRLAFPFAIAHALEKGLMLPKQLDIAGHHHLWQVTIKKLGTTSRKLNGKTYQTQHVQANDGEETLEFWLDINQQYHPVEIHFKSEDGWTTRYTLL